MRECHRSACGILDRLENPAAVGQCCEIGIVIFDRCEIASAVRIGDVLVVEVDGRRLEPPGIEQNLGTVSEGVCIRSAGVLHQCRELTRRVGVGAAAAGEAPRKPERLAALAQVEDHPAGLGCDLLETLERPAVAERAGRLVQQRGRARGRQRRVRRADLDDLGRVGVPVRAQRGGVGRLKGDLLDVTGVEARWR